MNTPGSQDRSHPGNLRQMNAKYSSMASVQTAQTMASLGFLAPGHGYVPKKAKPEKPFGPSFITIMNRTERGPGMLYLNYAYICFGMAILSWLGVALYFGHRNVHRMMVYRTEPLGALMAMLGVLFTGGGFQFIYKARVESNKWRRSIRFKPEGVYTVAAINPSYIPDDSVELQTGTYGERAITQIPKSRRTPHSRGGLWGSQPNLRSADRGLDTYQPPAFPGRKYPPGYDQLRNLGRSSPSLQFITEEQPAATSGSQAFMKGIQRKTPQDFRLTQQQHRPQQINSQDEAPESEL